MLKPLKKRGLEAKVTSSKSIFEKSEVKTMLDFISVLRDPSTNSQLLGVLSAKGAARDFGPASRDRIVSLASKLKDSKGKRGVSYFEALKKA